MLQWVEGHLEGDERGGRCCSGWRAISRVTYEEACVAVGGGSSRG